VIFCEATDEFKNSGGCPGPEGHGSTSVFGAGVWVSVSNNRIERSEDAGKTWVKVPQAGDGLIAVAFGYVK
jgi:hypothetical protein